MGAFKSATGLADAVVREAKAFVDAERAAFEELRTTTERAAISEV